MKRLLATGVAAAALLALLIPASASGSHVFPFPADHYVCYSARDTSEPQQNPPPVLVTDQFERAQYDPAPVLRFCAPADKNGEGVDDPVIHLKSYPITRVSPLPVVRRFNLTIANQFETVRIMTNLQAARELMVPSTKNSLLPPDETSPGFEHYKCYTFRPLEFPARTVTVADQFGQRTVTVVSRHRLCNPAQKNEEPIRFGARHLVCYGIEPVFVAFANVTALNQFGPELLFVGRERELCVPSLKTRAGPPQ
jgi:hypothetical protein